MQLVIDHSYDIHPKEVNEILKCCHPLWPGIKNLGQANHARTKGDVQIFKIVHKKYDFAAIYDGDCVVISLAETHF